MDHSPENLLRYLLIDINEGTLPTDNDDWPIGIVEPDSPDNAITIFGTTGVIQLRQILDGKVVERFGAQIRIRATDNITGSAKAQSIVDSIDQLRRESLTIETSDYLIHSVSRTTSVIPLGREQGTSRYLFTINVLINLTQV
jgi:hypothetical protein